MIMQTDYIYNRRAQKLGYPHLLEKQPVTC